MSLSRLSRSPSSILESRPGTALTELEIIFVLLFRGNWASHVAAKAFLLLLISSGYEKVISILSLDSPIIITKLSVLTQISYPHATPPLRKFMPILTYLSARMPPSNQWELIDQTPPTRCVAAEIPCLSALHRQAESVAGG